MSHASFLPEDYLAQKAERRTNLICLSLFAIVLAAVFGAFLVTNRQLTQVTRLKQDIDSQYQDAAIQIEELKQLEAQKAEMLNKAELASALVERVPRSVLLAELINRMPPQLSLLEFKLESDLIKTVPANKKSPSNRPQRGKTKRDIEAEQEKVTPPKYLVQIDLIGVAPTDLEVARFVHELNSYALLYDVNLKYTEEITLNDQMLREFEIGMMLDPDADIRSIEPLTKPRNIKNPMSDELEYSLSIGKHLNTYVGVDDMKGDE